MASTVSVNGTQILVDGKEFVAKGVALNEPIAFELLAAMGANTVRTYGGTEAGPVLDAAQKNGLKVIAGLWIRPQTKGLITQMRWRELPGLYNEPKITFLTQKHAELELVKSVRIPFGRLPIVSLRVDNELNTTVKPFVEQYKDHPALLCWGVGNEMELGATDFGLVWSVLEKAAKMVRQLDPNHPTMAALAEAYSPKVKSLVKDAPSIQIIGVNSYGKGLLDLEKRVRAQGWTGPIILSEFGPLGHWQASATPWGAPLEPNSGHKAEQLDSLLNSIQGKFQGEMAFYWGNKTEASATWHNLLLGPTGEQYLGTDVVLATHWGGTVLPKGNGAPLLQANWTTTGNQWRTMALGEIASVQLNVSDPDGDSVSVDFQVMAEQSGPAYPTQFPGAVTALNQTSIQVGQGLQAGHYRLYVTAKDGKGAAATDNLPFNVVTA